MEGISLLLLSIVILFIIFLIIKEIFKLKRFCVICIAVALTWIIFLFLYFLDIFEDKVILAILIGQSSIGIFYLLDNKFRDELKIFKLPFLLTLIIIAYYILSTPLNIIKNILFIAVIWFVLFLVYIYRNNKIINNLVNKLVECCKRW